jgi:hypothetical protein
MSRRSGSVEVTTRIEAALARFEDALEGAGAGTMTYMRPGLTDDQITTIASQTGVELTDELQALWTWRDGTDPANEAQPPQARRCGPIFRLTSLQQAIDFARQEIAFGDENGLATDAKNRWREDWLMIGKSREPIAATTGHKQKSEIWTNDIYGNVKSAASLAEAIDVWVKALREGWWEWLPDEERWTLNYEMVPREISMSRLT